MLLVSMIAIGFALAGPGAGYAEAHFSDLEFLVGDWQGEGTGIPGQGGGEFSFRWDLDRKVLVRTSSTDYPATKDRPAFTHRDLMVVYRNTGGGGLRAIYYDNEEHVIDYTVAAAQGSGIVQFVNERFRLTYTKTSDSSVSIRFEIASWGGPASFSTYLEGTARRKP